jgi:hypothetical protein
MSKMRWHVSNFVHSCESRESQHLDSGPVVLEPCKEKDCLRDCVAEKGGGPFSWVVQAG